MSEISLAPVGSHLAEACAAVLVTLPEWFGYDGALDAVRREAARGEGFVALDGDEVVGFVTTARIFDETLEITYLAVRREQRGHGIGRRLVAAVCSSAREQGAVQIVLLTLGPSAGSDHYGETVAFYRSIGFRRTKEIRNVEWGGAPSLVMSDDLDHLERAVRDH